MSDVKRITIKEFREAGYLQELNRQFLHPLGMAIEVVVNDDGTEALGGIWDYRDDPDGMRFDYANHEHSPPKRVSGARAKADRVQREMDARRPVREGALGYWIEPIPKEEP